MTAANPIVCTVPLDAPGVHHGQLRLPYSRDDSAWGSVLTPITVIGGAAPGPTVLVTGGNHGDEYEGPLAVLEAAATLRAEALRGRVILVPFLNAAAVRAGRRTSPIDGANMNRIFPGRPDGTPSQKIADYMARVLIPMADVVLDFHSGGKTLDFLPFAAGHILPDKAQEAACMAAVRAFGAPYAMQMLEIDAVGMLDTEVEAQGKVFVTTELGGGGTARAGTVRIARRGLRNLLIHAGVLEGAPEAVESVMLDMPDGDCFVFAGEAGMLDPVADLGDRVAAGQVIARIWPLDRTGTAPVDCRAGRTGLLTARHFPGLVQAGDCLAVVAVELGQG